MFENNFVGQVSLQAGLRTLHEAGPELRRAISGSLVLLSNIFLSDFLHLKFPMHFNVFAPRSLEEATDGELEPATRRNLPFFG